MERQIVVGGQYSFTPNKTSLLGKGATCNVYLGTSTSNFKVAIKVIDTNNLPKSFQRYLENELVVLYSLDDATVIKMLYHQEKDYYRYIVMEYCEGGTLKEFLSTFPDRKLQEREAQIIFSKVVKCLKYLLSVNIIHRDVKPENFLLTEKSLNAHIKVADFGFARKEKEQMYSILGTPRYMSPEVASRKEYNLKSDIYSLGCILYEMFSGDPPESYVVDLSSLNISKECKELMDKMLKFESVNRIGWEDLFKHPFIQFPDDSDSTYLQTIYYEFKKDHHLYININPKNTILELKQELEKLINIEVNHQILITPSGTELNNDDTILKCNLHKNRKILFLISETGTDSTKDTYVNDDTIQRLIHLKEHRMQQKAIIMYIKSFTNDVEKTIDDIELKLGTSIVMVENLLKSYSAVEDEYRNTAIGLGNYNCLMDVVNEEELNIAKIHCKDFLEQFQQIKLTSEYLSNYFRNPLYLKEIDLSCLMEPNSSDEITKTLNQAAETFNNFPTYLQLIPIIRKFDQKIRSLKDDIKLWIKHSNYLQEFISLKTDYDKTIGEIERRYYFQKLSEKIPQHQKEEFKKLEKDEMKRRELFFIPNKLLELFPRNETKEPIITFDKEFEKLSEKFGSFFSQEINYGDQTITIKETAKDYSDEIHILKSNITTAKAKLDEKQENEIRNAYLQENLKIYNLNKQVEDSKILLEMNVLKKKIENLKSQLQTSKSDLEAEKKTEECSNLMKDNQVIKDYFKYTLITMGYDEKTVTDTLEKFNYNFLVAIESLARKSLN